MKEIVQQILKANHVLNSGVLAQKIADALSSYGLLTDIGSREEYAESAR